MLLEREQDLEQLRYPIGRLQARAGLFQAGRHRGRARHQDL